MTERVPTGILACELARPDTARAVQWCSAPVGRHQHTRLAVARSALGYNGSADDGAAALNGTVVSAAHNLNPSMDSVLSLRTSDCARGIR